MIKKPSMLLEDILKRENIKHQKLLEKYPPDVPNAVCKHAFIRGLPIENSFNPKVGEYNFLFRTNDEVVNIWTYQENTNSALVSEANLNVKQLPHWKTAAHLIELSLLYSEAFELGPLDLYYSDYKWMYDFKPKNCINDIVFANLPAIEASDLHCGRVLKATNISNLASIMELILRDDKAYTAISLMASAFQAHACCLRCELSDHPYHDHLAEEPPIWQQANVLQNLEMCIVQSCRAVECLLGEPPSQKREGKVRNYKEHWISTVESNPDGLYNKANVTYLEFYYELFFNLRNPSAHCYGNIHYDLLRINAVNAQCFAAIILGEYIRKHSINNDSAMGSFDFNKTLLARVSKDMSTCRTKPINA